MDLTVVFFLIMKSQNLLKNTCIILISIRFYTFYLFTACQVKHDIIYLQSTALFQNEYLQTKIINNHLLLL